MPKEKKSTELVVRQTSEVALPETVDEMKQSLDKILPDGKGGKLTLQHGEIAVSFPLGGLISQVAATLGLKGRNVATKGPIKVGLDIS